MRLLSVFLHDRVLQEAERVIAFYENYLLNPISYNCKIKFKISRETGLVYRRGQPWRLFLLSLCLEATRDWLEPSLGTAEAQGFHYARVVGRGVRESGETGELTQIRA